MSADCKCSVCDHDCASYTPRAPLDPESLCYCGHGTTQHLQSVLAAALFLLVEASKSMVYPVLVTGLYTMLPYGILVDIGVMALETAAAGENEEFEEFGIFGGSGGKSCPTIQQMGKDIYKIKSFPADFITLQTSGEDVRKVVRTKFSTTSLPEQLLQLPTRGKLLLLLDHLPTTLFPLRFPLTLSYDQQGGLWAQWDRFIASGPKHGLKPDTNRSTSEVFHLGIWEVTTKKPCLTLESQDQSDKAVEAMDNLLCFIKTYIGPKIGTAFKEHAPVRANDWVLKLLKRDLKLHPSLFMGGPFFAVAAKEAGSGIVHLDWNDDKLGTGRGGGVLCPPTRHQNSRPPWADYLMLNTDRGADNYKIKYCEGSHEKLVDVAPQPSVNRIVQRLMQLIAPLRKAVQLVHNDLKTQLRKKTNLAELLKSRGGKYHGQADIQDSLMFSVYTSTGIDFKSLIPDWRGISASVIVDTPPGCARSNNSHMQTSFWEGGKRLSQGGLITLVWQSGNDIAVHLGVITNSLEYPTEHVKRDPDHVKLHIVFFDMKVELCILQELRLHSSGGTVQHLRAMHFAHHQIHFKMSS
ncbi:hypothetical protein DFH29DRAFT_871823 [Suillus ampliporus]|nr:hypothetical protein DFH29DRAFT_871823 [Suillus ampliporus]